MSSLASICSPSVALTRYDPDSFVGYVQRVMRDPAMTTFITSFIDINTLVVPLSPNDIVKVVDAHGTVQNHALKRTTAEQTYATIQRLATMLSCILADHCIGGTMDHLPANIPARALQQAGLPRVPAFLAAALHSNCLSGIRTSTAEELIEVYNHVQNTTRFYVRLLLKLLERQVQLGFDSAYNFGACMGFHKAAFLHIVAPWLVEQEAKRRDISVETLLRVSSPSGDGCMKARTVPAPGGDINAGWAASHNVLGLPFTVRLACDDVADEELEPGDLPARHLVVFISRDVTHTVFGFI
ncbi:hypothetical protein K523DRAFT_422276 [Schizophyllum commune Tattone D]|nr:hypothetical protein K523DRAFT_422276 [Schizophyllum commune Tattone D]